MKINNNYRKSGFSLVEMLIVVPIVILMIGVFITAIVAMTGDVLATRASNSLSYNIQDALNNIEQDVKLSGGYLSTNNIALVSPQGYDNDTTGFTNIDVAKGPILILNAYTTTNNPLNSNRSIVYASNRPNACNSTLITQNETVMMNVIYFVKDNTLWRRTVAPAGYETLGCVSGVVGAPWQQPSCALNISGAICKTQDKKMVDGIATNGFTLKYYPSSDPTVQNNTATNTSETDLVRAAALKTTDIVEITINASTTIAGRSVNQSGTIRATSPNDNTTAN